jgi:hypothetical protein
MMQSGKCLPLFSWRFHQIKVSAQTLVFPHELPPMVLWPRQKPIKKRQQKHGTALAIEVIAENFNSSGCR